MASTIDCFGAGTAASSPCKSFSTLASGVARCGHLAFRLAACGLGAAALSVRCCFPHHGGQVLSSYPGLAASLSSGGTSMCKRVRLLSKLEMVDGREVPDGGGQEAGNGVAGEGEILQITHDGEPEQLELPGEPEPIKREAGDRAAGAHQAALPDRIRIPTTSSIIGLCPRSEMPFLNCRSSPKALPYTSRSTRKWRAAMDAGLGEKVELGLGLGRAAASRRLAGLAAIGGGYAFV